jgi:hypothetical protein
MKIILASAYNAFFLAPDLVGREPGSPALILGGKWEKTYRLLNQ